MLKFLYLILPLAINLAGYQQSVINLFIKIRDNVLGISDTFVSLALAMAGFFVGIKLIRLSYDTMSDEQGSGLGGVKLSQIIGPIVIIALIAGYRYVIGGLDYATGVVVNNIADTATLQNEMSKGLLEITTQMDRTDSALFSAAKESLQKFDERRKRTSTTYIISPEVDASIESQWDYREDFGPIKAGEYNKYRYTDNGDGKKKTDNWNLIRKVMVQYGKAMARSEKEGSNNHGLIAWIVEFLFNTVYLIMMAMANIFLSLLALLGPFVLALSLFEPWKNSFITFIGKYIEVSFWIVIAKIIVWLTTAAGKMCTSSALEEYATLLADIYQYGPEAMESYYAFGRCITAIVVIDIAGLLALFSVPDLTSAIFSFGGDSAMDGADTGASAARTAANAPGKLAGGAVRVITNRKMSNSHLTP